MDVEVAVGTVIKRALEVIGSDERGRKGLLYVIGIVIFLLLLPMIAVVGMSGFLGEDGEVVLDQDIILSHLTSEQQEEIDRINQVCETISNTFRVYGLPANDQRKAQTVYVSYLLGREDETDFYIRLADCFNNASEWMPVYDLLGMEFGIVILPEEQQELDERFGVTGAPEEGGS